MVRLRPSSRKEYRQLDFGAKEMAGQLVDDMARTLEGLSKKRLGGNQRVDRARRARSLVSLRNQRRRRTQTFDALVAQEEMEAKFQECQAELIRQDSKLRPYEERLGAAKAHDSTSVLDDDLDLAPISTKETLDPHSAEYADRVLKELRFDDPDRVRERNLTKEQDASLRALLRRKAHVFLIPGAPLRPLTGEAEGVEFEINTGSAAPVYLSLIHI